MWVIIILEWAGKVEKVLLIYRLCTIDLVASFQGFSPAKLIACDVKCRREAHSTCHTIGRTEG